MASLKCSIASFGKLSSKCSTHESMKNIEEYQALSSCGKSIAGHLKMLKVNSKDLESEWQLIVARIGRFDLLEQCPSQWTVCPKHRAELGIRWRGVKQTCQHPDHTSKSKPDRGFSVSTSRTLYEQRRILIPVGSGNVYFVLCILYFLIVVRGLIANATLYYSILLQTFAAICRGCRHSSGQATPTSTKEFKVGLLQSNS